MSCTRYEKLVGVVTCEELYQGADDVINLEPPCKKMKKSDTDINEDSVSKSLSFVDNIKRMHHMQVNGSLTNCV